MILLERLLKSTKNNDLTILLASHNMREVERLCDEIIMMKNGQIVDRGTCDELINKHGRKNRGYIFKDSTEYNELE